MQPGFSPAPQDPDFAGALRLMHETEVAGAAAAVHLCASACYACSHMSKAKPTPKTKSAPAKAKAEPKAAKPVQVRLEAAKPARKTAPVPKATVGKTATEKPAPGKAGAAKSTAGKAAAAAPPAAKKSAAGRSKKAAPVVVAPPPYVSPFKAGDKVTHAVFGPGSVTDVEGERLVIKFTGGEKTILDGFVKAVKS